MWVFKSELHSHKQRWGQGLDSPGQGRHMQSQRGSSELGDTKEPSRNGGRAVCSKCKDKRKAEEGPRTGNDLLLIYEETCQTTMEMKDLGLYWNTHCREVALQTKLDGSQ